MGQPYFQIALLAQDTANSVPLAQQVLRGIVVRVGTRDNRVRVRPGLYVLRRTQMPSILVELAYLPAPGRYSACAYIDAQASRTDRPAYARSIAAQLDEWLHEQGILFDKSTLPAHPADSDSGEFDTTPAPAPAVTKKPPVTTEQRQEIKKELTGAPAGAATEEQVGTLKSLLKKLMDIDAEQEQFVQTIAMKTEGFSKIEADKCDALIEGVNNMLAGYEMKTAKEG